MHRSSSHYLGELECHTRYLVDLPEPSDDVRSEPSLLPIKHYNGIIAAIVAGPKADPIWASHMKTQSNVILSSGATSF